MITKIKGIWKFKYLIYNLVLRDLKIKYKGSTMGFLWSLLNPLLMIAVYTVAFEYVIKMKVENFAIFLFSALLPWTFLVSSLSMGAGCITDNGNLVKKVYFPREALPLSVVLVNLFHFMLTFLVLIPALFFFDVYPGFTFLFLPVIIFFQTLFVLGLTLTFSALNVYYRDVKHFLEVLLNLWFWVTPIIWPMTHLPPEYATLPYINPFTSFVAAYRSIILHDTMPSPWEFAGVVGFSLMVFIFGVILFQRKQRRFAEEI